MDGKISFRGKASQIIFGISFWSSMAWKRQRTKNCALFWPKIKNFWYWHFPFPELCSLMCGTWIGPNRAPTQNQPIFRVTDYTNGSPHVHLIQQRRNRSLDRCANKLFLLSNDNGKWKSWNRFLRSKDEIIMISNHEKIVSLSLSGCGCDFLYLFLCQCSFGREMMKTC